MRTRFVGGVICQQLGDDSDNYPSTLKDTTNNMMSYLDNPSSSQLRLCKPPSLPFIFSYVPNKYLVKVNPVRGQP